MHTLFGQVAVEAGKQRNDADVPAPVRSFMHAGFDDFLLSEVVRQGFEAPTPIQAQSLPVVMSVSVWGWSPGGEPGVVVVGGRGGRRA